MRRHEKRVWKQGYTQIAGCDEAGRGPLAGPVVAAAVIFPQKLILKGVNDSKKLTREKRQELFPLIISKTQYAVGIVDHTTIDEINIYQATLKAMTLAIEQLEADYALIDGRLNLSLEIPYECIIKGDQLSQSIAAASIIAKETRDRIMDEYHKEYPEYGFDRHKGYATELHREALEKYGRCPIHRHSFSVSALHSPS